MVDVIANNRYQAVKAQLDSLHYCQPFNIESCALVERLLSELLKTTEAYKRSQNELTISIAENKFNQQTLSPLQKENERLVKENNQLHLDVIQAREQSEEVDLRWKAANRQLQNEVRDLHFLVEAKDLKIKALDRELGKMRAKIERTLAKMYLPSQDEIVEGLAGDILERGELNIMARAGGHQQDFELSHPQEGMSHDISAAGGFLAQAVEGSQQVTIQNQLSAVKGSVEQNKKWADELAKADERGNRFRLQMEEAQRRKTEVEDKLQHVEKQVLVREEEIKRLIKLYEGGQNLECIISVKHTHESNEKTIGKLANQVDFLNRENHSLQQQVSILKGDKKTVKTLDHFRAEIESLTFENGQLKKDVEEYTRIVKEFQDKEHESKSRVRDAAHSEDNLNKQLEVKVAQINEEQEKLKGEQERMSQVRAAYNADKRQLVERITELERVVSERDRERQELDSKLSLLDQSAAQYRNEINFWNGKCSTLRRDNEYQERHILRYKDENSKLVNENDYLKVRVDNMDREVNLLRRQIGGLQEDNERINRMYQVVEREAVFSSTVGRENMAPNYKLGETDNRSTLRASGGAGQGKWKTVDDDNHYSTGNFSNPIGEKKIDF